MTVVESLALKIRTKRCAHCGQTKPWGDFHAKTKWADGTMRQPQAYCKPCQTAYSGDWHRTKRLIDPEWQRQRAARARESLKADPERYATSLERRMQWARRKYGYRRLLSKRHRVPFTVGRQALDPRPFGAWLRTIGDTPLQISVVTGLEESQVRKYLTAARPVMEGVVDRVLCRVNTDTTLRDLYPELYNNLGEADGQCAVGHPQGDSSSLAPRRSPTARSIQRSEQEAA